MDRNDEMIKQFGKRVGYSETELEKFKEGGHRVRQIERLTPGIKTIYD
jgi:hypothetical protein